MNKITTKFRTLGRLSVWVSISFGIAIATSQTANAWEAINNIDNNVYFLTCSTDNIKHGVCANSYMDHDGEMALGHVLSCGQDQEECGAGQGQDIYVEVRLVGAVRLLYPSVHVPPNGVVSFSPGFYTTSDDELFPSIVQIPSQSPLCQKWTHCSLNKTGFEGCYYAQYSWINQPTRVCDQAPDRGRVP